MQTTGTDITALGGRLTWRILKSSGSRSFLLAVASSALDDWSKAGRLRRYLARGPAWLIRRAHPAAPSQSMLAADLGDLLTGYANATNQVHAQDPLCHARGRADALRDFITHTDFGEIKEMVEGSEACILATLEELNAAVWPYPAKIACLVATLVASGNISLKAVDTLVRPLLDNLGPDLTADILLSCLKELQGGDLGRLATTVSELVRRLHTGRLLLSRGGRPLFEVYLTRFFSQFLDTLDPEVFTKARIALAEDRESLYQSLTQSLTENPALLRAGLASLSARLNPRVRARRIKTDLLADMDPDDLELSLSEGLADLDTQEASEILNLNLALLNRIHERQPEILGRLIAPLGDAIDIEALGQVLDWLVPELVEALRPALEAALPALVQGLCELLEQHPEPDVLDPLRTFLASQGGAR